MTNTNINIYKEALVNQDYQQWMDNPNSFETEDTGHAVDINPFLKEIKKIKKDKKFDKLSQRPSSDGILAEVAHKTFLKLPGSLLTDNRLWQWITLNLLYEYSVWRWDLTDDRIKEKPTLKRHLFSGTGVDGLSRNSIARLVVPCQDLVLPGGDYSLVKILFQNQQTEQSLSQSLQSMNPNFFRAMVNSVSGLTGPEVREKVKKINHLAVAYNFDAMTETQIFSIIK